MDKQSSYLSIKHWGLVLLGVCIIQTILHFTYVHYKQSGRPFDPIFSKFKDIDSKHVSSNKKVLFFGSSLLGQGLDCPSSSMFKLSEDKSLSIYKIWKSEDPFRELFSTDKYTQDILNLKPDLICIQTELAAINLEWLNYESHFFKTISIENRTLRQVIYENKNSNFNWQSYCDPASTFQATETDTLNLSPVKRSIKRVENIASALSTLETFRKAGIQIAIVDIPRPYALEQQYKTQTFLTELNQLLKTYKNDLQVDYWSYSGPALYHNKFIDRGHLNVDGRTIYTKWLLETIQTKAFN